MSSNKMIPKLTKEGKERNLKVRQGIYLIVLLAAPTLCLIFLISKM